jgi:putative endonuclease
MFDTKCSAYLLGKRSEKIACEYLECYGLRLITHNYYCLFGEIDLIMRDKDVIVFVEVRARRQPNFLGALESITEHKRSRIIKAAMFYLQRHRLIDQCICRFDVVAVREQGGHFDCQWIKQAFELGVMNND